MFAHLLPSGSVCAAAAAAAVAAVAYMKHTYSLTMPEAVLPPFLSFLIQPVLKRASSAIGDDLWCSLLRSRHCLVICSQRHTVTSLHCHINIGGCTCITPAIARVLRPVMLICASLLLLLLLQAGSGGRC